MPKVARVGDTSSHGGTIVSGSTNVKANGLGIARQGDLHSCPIRGHGVTALTAIVQDVHVNGLAVCTVGAIAGCGAVIVDGSSNVEAT